MSRRDDINAFADFLEARLGIRISDELVDEFLAPATKSGVLKQSARPQHSAKPQEDPFSIGGNMELIGDNRQKPRKGSGQLGDLDDMFGGGL